MIFRRKPLQPPCKTKLESMLTCTSPGMLSSGLCSVILCVVYRKCSASNRILSAKDHASIQINLADVDESTGRMTVCPVRCPNVD